MNWTGYLRIDGMPGAQWMAVIGLACLVFLAVLAALIRFSDRVAIWASLLVLTIAGSTASAWLLAHGVGHRTVAYRQALAIAVSGSVFVGGAVGATVGGFRNQRLRRNRDDV